MGLDRCMMFLLIVLLLSALNDGSPHCVNDRGRYVDWWIAYKLPRISDHANPSVATGSGYFIMDSSSLKFELSSKSMLSESGTFISDTLAQVYTGGEAIGSLMWNDHTPDHSTSSSRAHSKGVMGFDKGGGFFIRHSVPRFPPKLGENYSYPDSATIYGQTLFCIDLDIYNLNLLAQQFLINNPQIYSNFLPRNFTEESIRDLSLDNMNKDDLFSIKKIKMLNGFELVDFAKSRAWNDDLWEGLIAPKLDSNMKVETWGRPIAENACHPNFPFNVKNIDYIDFSNFNISFTRTRDHSKWGVTDNQTFVCIGDINRMASQRNRGGGATCFSNSSIYSAFMKIISKYDFC